MTKSFKTLAGLILCFLFHSCISLVQDQFGSFDTLPVVNAVLVKDSTIEVRISQSSGLDSNLLPAISNANISLYKDGVFIESIPHIGDGIYHSTYKATEGSVYSCEISIPSYDNIFCEDSIPDPIDLKINRFSNQSGLDNEGYFYPSVDFVLKDDTATKDYYEILIFTREKNENVLIRHAFNEKYAFLLNEGFEPYSTFSLLFSDEFLSLESDTLSLSLSVISYQSTCQGDSCWYRYEEQMVFIEGRKVSEAYYKYKKQFYIYEKTIYGDFIEGALAPVPLYSNVENGSGVFVSYSKAVDSLLVEEEIIVRH